MCVCVCVCMCAYQTYQSITRDTISSWAHFPQMSKVLSLVRGPIEYIAEIDFTKYTNLPQETPLVGGFIYECLRKMTYMIKEL